MKTVIIFLIQNEIHLLFQLIHKFQWKKYRFYFYEVMVISVVIQVKKLNEG